MSKRAFVLLAGLGVLAWQAVPMAHAAGTAPHYTIVRAAPQDGGGEPNLISAPNGEFYLTYPSTADGTPFYRSATDGRTWVKGGTADSASGDDCIATDQASKLYLCNLNGSKDALPLQADVFKSLDDGASWQQGAGVIPGAGASSQPFAVDRPWVDAYIPRGGTTKTALVALMYHDFGPSQVWVNTSSDGGKTFGAPTDIIASSPQAQADTFCNSVPAGVKIVKSGPHAGRIYAAWIAADVPTSAATGCNITQLDTFHDLWVAWSDDRGASWTSQLAYDGGFGHDTSTPFVAFTLDDAGNPYFGFADNLKNEWDMWVVYSRTGGTTWNSSPIKVNKDTGTHIYPAIAAGSPGEVDIAYLATPSVIGTLPYGKAAPGGGAGDKWYLYAAQSRNLYSGHPTWTVSRLTPTPMHVGDICNLGIFCVAPNANRNLLDYISIALDPFGRAHIAYTDDYSTKNGTINVANQVSGPTVRRR